MSNLVSIVIPLFNRQELIMQTIRSLQMQTYIHWQAIVVDDGSTDDSIAEVEKLSREDQRIQLSRRNRLPKGAPVCRNIGIEKAEGEYLIFLDSDDLLAPWCLSTRVAEFEKNSQADFLVFYGAFFTNEINDASVLWNRFDERNDLERFLKGESVWQTTAPIWRTSYLRKENIVFNEEAKSSQDWEFPVKALLKNPMYKKVMSMPDYFVRRTPGVERISEGHWTKGKILNRAELYKNVIEEYLAGPEYGTYRLYVLTIILRQHHYLLKNNKESFTFSNLIAIKQNFKSLSTAYKMAFLYLKIGNKLVVESPAIYQLVMKVSEKLFLRKLFYNESSYRSPMAMGELDSFKRKLNLQSPEG